jgi:hypothetical protein
MGVLSFVQWTPPKGLPFAIARECVDLADVAAKLSVQDRQDLLHLARCLLAASDKGGE